MPRITPKSNADGELIPLLADPVKSDEFAHLKFGGPSDRHSVAALYRSDGREDGITAPNPELNGFLTVIVLEHLNPFTLKRNGKALSIPACPQGTFGIHDLRNTYSSGKYPVFSLSLVFSTTFLSDLELARPHRAMELLRERVSYDAVDQTLLHLGMALLPSLQKPEAAERLFVDQMLLATSTYVVGKYGNKAPLGPTRGMLSARHERIAKEYLSANVQGNVSLFEVATACGLSPTYFARSFKRTTGTPPYRWLLLQRLEKARSLLRSTDDSLADIAAACGFVDQSHFTRAFSRAIGISPGAWRRHQRS